jgi:Domain of unknown function (DUF4397)/Sortase domain
MPAAAAQDAGLLRVAHLSPDTPAVDVSLAPLPADGSAVSDPGPDVATGLGYGTVGGYDELPAGRYAVSIRAAGAPPSTPPVLTAEVEVTAGTARTAIVGGRFADLTLQAVPDDLSTPPAGAARVRVLAAAGSAGPLDVTLAGTPLARELPFATAGRYVPVPAGAAALSVDGRPVPGPGLRLAAGAVVSLLVLDGPDGALDVRVVVDAAGPAEVPTGAVAAGSGPAEAAPVVLLVVATTLVARALRGRRRASLAAVALTLGATVLPVGAAPAAAAVPPAVTSSARESAVPPPVQVLVPSVGIDAALQPVGLDPTGALAPPARPGTAGWHAGGPAPGGTGPAVLTGHVDWAGRPAAFAGLGRVTPGDEVQVVRADGSTARFRVDAVHRYAKDDFPTATVYGPTPDAQLRLITCGGEFDRAAGSYRDNVVVTATLVG